MTRYEWDGDRRLRTIERSPDLTRWERVGVAAATDLPGECVWLDPAGPDVPQRLYRVVR